MPLKHDAEFFFASLQQIICKSLEALDGSGRFREDMWPHAEGGGGITRVLQGGTIFEKAGVNFSRVSTKLSDVMALRMNVLPQAIDAAGISLVIHPVSPMIPTVHMNLRHLRLASGDEWFGGGIDLTPWYLFEEDARHFHATLKQICDTHDRSFYPRAKQSCDEYFFIKHRNETRGIGGIFFDYQRERLPLTFALVKALGESFLETYVPIVERRKSEPWGPAEKTWQLIRRGRYVEFNLIYDRGTLFGLETNGRTESILMSLPPEVMWLYDVQPEAGSREEALLKILQQPREWA